MQNQKMLIAFVLFAVIIPVAAGMIVSSPRVGKVSLSVKQPSATFKAPPTSLQLENYITDYLNRILQRNSMLAKSLRDNDITMEALVDYVKKYLQDHPELSDKPVDQAIDRAMFSLIFDMAVIESEKRYGKNRPGDPSADGVGKLKAAEPPHAGIIIAGALLGFVISTLVLWVTTKAANMKNANLRTAAIVNAVSYLMTALLFGLILFVGSSMQSFLGLSLITLWSIVTLVALFLVLMRMYDISFLAALFLFIVICILEGGLKLLIDISI